MSSKKIITENNAIYKFIISLGLSLYLTLPQLRHLATIISASTQFGYSGKLSDVFRQLKID